MSAAVRKPADPSDRQPGAAQSRTTLIERSIPMADNRLSSRDLFAATREIIISHGEDTYRLRLTAQNKLILTK
jgi:hemin uptake protein HemP